MRMICSQNIFTLVVFYFYYQLLGNIYSQLIYAQSVGDRILADIKSELP